MFGEEFKVTFREQDISEEDREECECEEHKTHRPGNEGYRGARAWVSINRSFDFDFVRRSVIMNSYVLHSETCMYAGGYTQGRVDLNDGGSGVRGGFLSCIPKSIIMVLRIKRSAQRQYTVHATGCAASSHGPRIPLPALVLRTSRLYIVNSRLYIVNYNI